MIQGTVKTEAQYRAIYLDSSSSLKDFSTDRRKYHKKYILNEVVEDEDSKAATMGRMVETLLMEPHLFDERFYLSTCMSTPTGLMFEFVEALYKHTVAATADDGTITRNFEDICKDAYTDSGFKIKLDAVLTKFIGSDAEVYYKEIREVRPKHLTVVAAQEIANAEKIVIELKTNPTTAEIVNLVNDVQYSVHNQLQVEGYDVLDHKFKSMMDKIVIDEVHTFLTELSFREKYQVYWRLAVLGIPIVALSGSVPLFILSKFAMRLCLSRDKQMNDIKIIQGGVLFGHFPHGFRIKFCRLFVKWKMLLQR